MNNYLFVYFRSTKETQSETVIFLSKITKMTSLHHLPLILYFVISLCSSEKKFPVPRHILADAIEEKTSNFSTTLPINDVVNSSTSGPPLISFADKEAISEASRLEEIRTGDMQVETTTVPESLKLFQEESNFCTHSARCEPLPPNATW